MVLEPGGDVGSAYRLGHADPRLPAGAGISFGHVGGGLLRMSQYAPNPQRFQFDEHLPEDRFDKKDVGDSIPLECFSQEARTGDLLVNILDFRFLIQWKHVQSFWISCDE